MEPRRGTTNFDEIPILRIYKLAPEKCFVAYFFTLQTKNEEFSYLVTPNIYQKRSFILGKLEQFIRIYNDMPTPDDMNDKDDHNKKIPYGLLKAKSPPKKLLQGTIGTDIYSSLGLEKVFQAICDPMFLHRHRSLIIVTNDYEIPWEWITVRDKMLCELIDVGKLYPKNIDNFRKSAGIVEKESAIRDESDFYAKKKNFKVILLHDDMESLENKKNYLPNIHHEIDSIKAWFIDAGFSKDQIREIDGQKENLEVSLKEELITSDNLKIIHFSGHLDAKGNLRHRFGEVCPEELKNLDSENSKLLESKPFVFLNSCSSGQAPNVYKEASQLSTTFAALGASACLTTICSIDDKMGSKFSEVFYKVLLNEWGCSIGRVLKKARTLFSEQYGKEYIEPYFFTIFGSPEYEIFSEFSKNRAIGMEGPPPEDLLSI